MYYVNHEQWGSWTHQDSENEQSLTLRASQSELSKRQADEVTESADCKDARNVERAVTLTSRGLLHNSDVTMVPVNG